MHPHEEAEVAEEADAGGIDIEQMKAVMLAGPKASTTWSNAIVRCHQPEPRDARRAPQQEGRSICECEGRVAEAGGGDESQGGP